MALQNAAIKDFSGGLNVADDPFKLTSKYLTVADNIIVGSDNDASIRYGYAFLEDLYEGNIITNRSITVSLSFTTGSPLISFPIASAEVHHQGFIKISGFVPDTLYNGVKGSELNGIHNIRYNGTTAYFNVRTPANATVSTSYTFNIETNNRIFDGEVADLAFFQGYVHAFSKEGVIIAYNIETKEKKIIWNEAIANASTSNPPGWRRFATIDYASFKQSLIIVNGRFNDKPLEINHNRNSGAICQYLVDPSTVSNAFVYAADYVTSFAGYLVLGNPNNTSTPNSLSPTVLDISAYGTSGVFTGNPNPDDAAQVDVGIVSDTIDPRIRGFGKIRDKLFLAFSDTGMLGTLGSYDSNGNHRPQFNDQIPQHGALNNRVIHTIGNDIFMCDYAGIPAFSLSQQSAVIVPERMSIFIDPMLNAHLSRLSQTTKDEDVWAIYSTRDRQYMLFMPKFDDASRFMGDDNGIFIVEALRHHKLVVVGASSHTVSKGDYVDITGATSIFGLDETEINGRRKVYGVIDGDYFIIEVGAVPLTAGISGGGTSINFAPVNDEVIAYVFHYHPSSKIRRWSRFRGLTFTAGCITNNGRLIFHKDGKLYQFGTSDAPLYGDELFEYDYIWSVGELQTVGSRVKISEASNDIYECIVEHTSSDTFEIDVTQSNNWQPYTGKTVNFELETPWSELKYRNRLKVNKFVQIDAYGKGLFTLTAFVDKLDDVKTVLQNPEFDTALNGAISMEFAGQDLGGFGFGNQPYGGARNTITRQMFDFPFQGKQVKLQVSGSTSEKFKLTSISLMYNLGGYWA